MATLKEKAVLYGGSIAGGFAGFAIIRSFFENELVNVGGAIGATLLSIYLLSTAIDRNQERASQTT